MDVKESDILGEDIAGHWYYRSKAAALLSLLQPEAPSVILDVGAGSGFFSRHLLTHTAASEAWCVDTGYDGDTDAMDEQHKPIHYRRSLPACHADVVLLMDVLEHVDDDVGLLAECAKQASDSARFLISVPAFQFLWSGHDEFLGHKRRYTLKGLEKVVENAGLRPVQGCYYFGLVFPLALATRYFARWRTRRDGQPPRSQLRKHSPLINSSLATLCRAELPGFSFNRMAGLTAFCLARRP